MAGRFTSIGLEVVIRGMANWQRANTTMRRQMGLTGAQLQKTSKSARSATTALVGMGNTIRNVGNQALILGFQLSFLASGAMFAVINKAVEFERSLIKINTLVGVSMDQVRGYTKAVLDLAPALGKSPAELADALFFITSAGFLGAAESMDILVNSSKAASLGLGTVKAVANVATSAMLAFEKQNLTAARAVDILTAIVRKGKFEVEELAPSLGKVLGLAAVLGITFEDVGAFVATFTRLGVPAAVAVTSLRSALAAIINPTKASEEALAAVGTTSEEVQAAIADPNIGLTRTLLAIQAAFLGDTEAAGDFVGSVRGLAGFLAVTGPLAESFAQNFIAMQESVGLVEEGFDRYRQTTSFALEATKASFEALAISAGAVLLPVLNRVLFHLSNFLSVLRELAIEHPKVTFAIGAIGIALSLLGPLLIVTGLLISSLGTLVIGIGAVAGALAFLINPILFVVAAFGLLAVGIVGALVVSMDEAREKLDEKGLSLSKRAFKWGENLILSFAYGMGVASAAIVQVLVLIGNMIRDQLIGRSPPKLLPDIDEWGMQAMNEYLKGWLLADFSIFNDVSKTIEKWIRSFAQNIPELDLIPKIIGSRADIAEIIEEIKNTGSVTQEALDELFNSIGATNPLLENYIRQLNAVAKANKAVADAQDVLNATQEEYKNLLKPITDELKEIDDFRQDTVDSLRKEAIQKEILEDPEAPALARELALTELRQIELKKQQRTLEDQRDVEVSAAQEAVNHAQILADSAKEVLDTTKAKIDLQIENNNLIQDQIKLIESLKEKEKAALKGLKGGIDDATGALGDFAEELENIKSLFGGGGVGGGADEGGVFDDLFDFDTDVLLARIALLVNSIRTQFILGFNNRADNQPLVDTLRDVWSDVIALSIEKIDSEGITAVIKDWIVGIMKGAIVAAAELIPWDELWSGLKTDSILADFATNLDDLGRAAQELVDSNSIPEANKAIEEFLEVLFNVEGKFSLLKSDPIIGFFFDLAEILDIDVSESLDKVAEKAGGTDGEGGLTGFLGRMGDEVVASRDSLKIMSDHVTLKSLPALGLLDDIFKLALLPTLKSVSDKITQDTIPTIGEKLSLAVDGTWESLQEVWVLLSGPFSDAWGWITDFWNDDVVPAINGVLEALGFNVAGNSVQGGLAFAIEAVKEKIDEIAKKVSGSFTTAFNNVKTQVIEKVTAAFWGVVDSIVAVMNHLIALGNMIPGVDIPEVYVEHSPSKFSQAFMSGSDAIEHMANTSIPMLASAMHGQLGNAMAPLVAGQRHGINSVGSIPSGSSINNSRTSNVNMGGQTINNGMDAASFHALVERAMRDSL